jgi:Transposase, Mutator family
VAGLLPKELARVIDKRLAMIFAQPDATKGHTAAQRLAAELEADHPDAAASLREGLSDMFAVRRFGVGATLALTLTSRNPIESMISIAKRTTTRVTRWKDGTMKKRWVAAGIEPSDPSAGSRAIATCPSSSRPSVAKSRRVRHTRQLRSGRSLIHSCGYR